MIPFLLFLVVVLIGLTAAAVMGKIGGFMADPTSTQSFDGLPADGTEGEPSADDFAALQFSQAFRGYRMDQVDKVMDALTARLRVLESERAPLTAGGAVSTAPGDPQEVSSQPREQ